MKRNFYLIAMVLSLLIAGQGCIFQPKTIKLPSEKYYLQEERSTGIVKLYDNSGVYPVEGNIIGFMVAPNHVYGWHNGNKADITFFIIGFKDGVKWEFHSLSQFDKKLESLNIEALNMNDEITFAGIFGPDRKSCEQVLLRNGLRLITKGRNCLQIELIPTPEKSK